jgi:PP-loop superfamily ATP-utilizing enzyme
MKKRNHHPNPPVVGEEVGVLSEEELARIEAEPELQQMMKDSIQAEREGRVVTHEQVKAMLRKRRHG